MKPINFFNFCSSIIMTYIAPEKSVQQAREQVVDRGAYRIGKVVPLNQNVPHSQGRYGTRLVRNGFLEMLFDPAGKGNELGGPVFLCSNKREPGAMSWG
ncbi:MAG: hypothetical protein KC800_33240, partial [Candidatus Eremiobacteraeota bacterium]|nr:hypothetical protein [Candidatus Eremiobacteraeota bacterium]